MSDIFSLTKLVIVDSLESHEFQTGHEIETFARTLFADHGLPLQVERHSVSWPDEFQNVLDELVVEAKDGARPLLHVEMHGDPLNGLEFASGGTMKWGQVSELLIDLNRATRFNLVCIFAACYGAYFATELWVNRPSPCFGLLAPEDEIDPGEIYRAFMCFYRELAVSQDMGKAAALVARDKLTKGRWMNQTAAGWLPKVLQATVEQHLSADGLRAMAARVSTRAGAEGATVKIEKLALVETARRHIGELAFDRFFMVADIPENAERFRLVRERVIKEILPLLGK